MWTNETTVELFGKAHHPTVYRKQAQKGKNMVPTVKHGGGLKMFGGRYVLLPLVLCAKHDEI